MLGGFFCNKKAASAFAPTTFLPGRKAKIRLRIQRSSICSLLAVFTAFAYIQGRQHQNNENQKCDNDRRRNFLLQHWNPSSTPPTAQSVVPANHEVAYTHVLIRLYFTVRTVIWTSLFCKVWRNFDGFRFGTGKKLLLLQRVFHSSQRCARACSAALFPATYPVQEAAVML
jgi:hypothetical protein